MKKITLITISIFITAFSYGQCVPNTNYTSQGIYPDTVDNLPKATVGLAYSEDITVVTPLDTVFMLIPATVDYIKLTSVSGLLQVLIMSVIRHLVNFLVELLNVQDCFPFLDQLLIQLGTTLLLLNVLHMQVCL